MGKERELALQELDAATDEYEKVSNELKNKYKDLDAVTDKSLELIASVETFVETIRHRPSFFSPIKRKMSHTVKKFTGRKELERKERNRDIGVAAVAGGVAAAGGVSIFAFMRGKFKNNLILWIIGFVLFVIVLAGYALYRLFSRVRTAKQAYEQAQKLKEETYRLLLLLSKADASIKKIQMQFDIVDRYLTDLTPFKGETYKAMPLEKRKDLGSLYNSALTLTEFVSTQIG